MSDYAGVELDKSHQRDDWGQRPLPPESLLYAQMDTHFLPYLRDELCKHLVDTDNLAEAQELFHELTLLPPSEPRSFDPEGYWQLGKPNFLNRREMLVLREVYLLREGIAQKQNVPPFRVMNNNALVKIARHHPKTNHQLHTEVKLAPSLIRRYGRQIIKAVKRGKTANHLPPPPSAPYPDPEITTRYTALHTWRRERAIKRGVDSDVIISKKALWDLAHKAPATLDDLKNISHMGPWRMENYGEDILDVLQQHR